MPTWDWPRAPARPRQTAKEREQAGDDDAQSDKAGPVPEDRRPAQFVWRRWVGVHDSRRKTFLQRTGIRLSSLKQPRTEAFRQDDCRCCQPPQLILHVAGSTTSGPYFLNVRMNATNAFACSSVMSGDGFIRVLSAFSLRPSLIALIPASVGHFAGRLDR